MEAANLLAGLTIIYIVNYSKAHKIYPPNTPTNNYLLSEYLGGAFIESRRV